MAPPTLLLITGPPGTGKSSLADAAAAQLGAAVLGWDWAMAALTTFPTVQAEIRDLSWLEHRRLGWSILWNLAVAQLRRGQPVVLDGVARDEEVEGTRSIATSTGSRLLVVATSCRDRELHRSLVEGRVRDIPGWHELEWSHVDDVVRRWTPPATADLDLDAADPFDRNTRRLLALLGA